MGEVKMCKKIIVRNKIYRKGELNSKLAMLSSEQNFNSLKEFNTCFCTSSIMSELFGEDDELNNIKESLLYRKYQEIFETGNNNNLFCYMYKIKSDLAISLSEHIYLHHISNDLSINGERILPWECIDSKIYIADTWWATDQEILDDMSNVPFIEFMAKYKAY